MRTQEIINWSEDGYSPKKSIENFIGYSTKLWKGAWAKGSVCNERIDSGRNHISSLQIETTRSLKKHPVTQPITAIDLKFACPACIQEVSCDAEGRLISEVQRELCYVICNREHTNSSLGTCSNEEAHPLPAYTDSNRCLICRKDDCRGNLYCNMLPTNNNTYGELKTLNRKKSVVQNRRKSALENDGHQKMVANNSIAVSDINMSDGDKCSISQKFHSKLKSSKTTPHHLQSIEEIQHSPLHHLVLQSSDDDDVNFCRRTSNKSSNKFMSSPQNCPEGHSKCGRHDANQYSCLCSNLSSSIKENFAKDGYRQESAPDRLPLENFQSARSCRLKNHSQLSPVSAKSSESKSKTSGNCAQSKQSDGLSRQSSSPTSARPKSIYKNRLRRLRQSTSTPLSSFTSVLWFLASVILFNFTASLVVSGAYVHETNGPTGVCTSIDVRNKPHALQNLTGCRVIEGFLVLTLMDEAKQSDFENYSFPLLTEITDFLMVYRVSGLRSFSKIFPNLQVIRGLTLFEGFALIVFENPNIEEIGLPSLTSIGRGGVRIEKNPVLCFVHTIDWLRITTNASPETLYFRYNKATNECPLCGFGNVKGETSSVECPLFGKKRYCWNQHYCQKICPPECGNRSCNRLKKCCNESCLGDCSDDGKYCSSCRGVLAYSKTGEKNCVQKCPPDTYLFQERRCLTKKQCIESVKPLRSDKENHPYVPFDGECLLNCKSGYQRVNDTCVRCHNKCPVTCNAMVIYTILEAENLRGCTVISGDLMISIRQAGPHVVKDLERALSTIEEITGYLKITRTYSILSLSFLKELRVIRGTTLDEGKYALYILDNQNLQNLWGVNQNVTIERGKVFFHFNPKLCYNKIEALKPFVMDNNTFDLAEVARDSNGDRVACDVRELIITSITPYETAAMIMVQAMTFEDDRVFLGYQFYYMEAANQNVSIYENRHGCGYDSWNVDDDSNRDGNHLFTHLKPYTQYAVYVKTYTIASEKKGGQSKVTYFTTLPSTPDPVRNLEYNVLNYSSIEIRWIEPREPKGNLTEYRITAEISPDNAIILEQRNYCIENIKASEQDAIPDEPKKPPVAANEDSCRSICKELERRTNQPVEEEPMRENEIDFEDAIQNFVYVRRVQPVDPKRQKRSTSSSDKSPSNTLPEESNQKEAPPKEELVQIKDSHGWYTAYGRSVNASVKSIILTDLKHYSSYKIYVSACREGNGTNCSTKTRVYPRTAKKDGADDIQNLTAHIENINNTRNNVRFVWREPSSPNGLIVSYSIKYNRVDIEHSKPVEKCITYREYKNFTRGYIVYDMAAGNYSVQVAASSLAGEASYGQPVYFYIKDSGISWQITTLVVCLVIVLILAGVGYWFYRVRCRPPPDDLKLFTSVNPEYISMQYTPDEWEIPREKIIQLRELGQGSFGMVYEGIVKNLQKDGEDIACAIKTVNENATDRERINFLNEASVMKAFDTFHVVRLLGVVSRDQPTLVIMELMTNGDLKGYLRSNRPDSEQAKNGEVQVQPPTLKRILQMAIEIADGMAYLSAKKFVHRDLAARNCMVAEDLTVKIGDFGMTRDIYETDYYRKGTKGLLPVRWMAPESLKDGVFSSSSDVFSYGVVLWEMATLASQPYQGLSNDQVLRYVIDGGVMERPENCPDKLYNLMRRCWQHRPTARPSFMEIIDHLLDDANQRFRDVSFFHSEQGQELYKHIQTVSEIDDTTPLRLGDDDFKLDVGENFLMDRTDSHLVPEEAQHSPYSLGSAIVSNSIPDGTSKRNNENNSPSTVTTNNKYIDPMSTTATASTVQSFSNSLVPPRLRRMWRNKFLGNGNSNYSNRSCNGAGGGEATAASETRGIASSASEAVSRALGTGSNNGGGSNSSGIGGIFSGLMGFGQNNANSNGNNFRSIGKSGQKMSQEKITNPLLNDTSFDEVILSPQPTTLNFHKPEPLEPSCNHNDGKVRNSNLSEKNALKPSSSPYFQEENQLPHKDNQSEQQWLYSNGFLPSINPTTPLLPSQSSSSSPHHISSVSPRFKRSSNFAKGSRDNFVDPTMQDDIGSNYRKLLTANSITPLLQQTPQQNTQHVDSQTDGTKSFARRRSPPSASS